ncbi:hypothetical protein MMC11_000133 [Xylographa trunciseda]|nr:hypothetical protein [Xylographa trunciseda]
MALNTNAVQRSVPRMMLEPTCNRTLMKYLLNSFVPAIASETSVLILELFADSYEGFQAVKPKFYFKKFVLNVSLTTSFGTRISSVRDAILEEIVEVEEALTRYRSHTHNLQDYIPFLRNWSSSTNDAKKYKARRDKYMKTLMDQLQADIANGRDLPCSIGKVLKESEDEFNDVELGSLSLTLLSAGLDTIPANLTQAMAVLASDIGRKIQDKLIDSILSYYGTTEKAWIAVTKEERVPYLMAFVQEVLRYFSVVPMGFPRVNIQPLRINGATIPEGTWFYMNARSANLDPARFEDPERFLPERYMTPLRPGDGPPAGHYSFGAGRRACVGYHLANRLMYAILGQMVLAWSIESLGEIDINPFTYNQCQTSLVAEPKDFE